MNFKEFPKTIAEARESIIGKKIVCVNSPNKIEVVLDFYAYKEPGKYTHYLKTKSLVPEKDKIIRDWDGSIMAKIILKNCTTGRNFKSFQEFLDNHRLVVRSS